MKKLLFLFFAALCILIASCSKDSGFMPGSDPFLAMDKGSPACGPVIYYSPADDGDDTEELGALISGAESGAVIKLSAGVYHLGYMEIVDFIGSIVGAGVDKTIVYPKTPLTYKIQFTENIVPCWIRLTGGHVCISQMTFNTDVMGPIHDYSEEPTMGEDLFSIFVCSDYNEKYRPADSYQKCEFRNINFIGGKDGAANGYLTETNTIIGIWSGSDFWWPLEGLEYPLTKGDYLITDCYFDYFLDGAEGFGLGEYATMKVLSSKFNNCLWPLYFTANHGPVINITNNIFTNSWDGDIIIEDLDWGILSNTYINPRIRSRYALTGNLFYAASSASSVILWDIYTATDPENVPPMLITLKGNIFNLIEGSIGISAYNSQNAVIQNNKFRGSCSTGLMVDGINTDRLGTPLPLEGKANKALILGNNFAGLNASVANIYLGENSSHCMVVGSGKENVVDLGDFNKIVGMKKIPGYIGSRIKDNFRMWHGRRHH